MILSQIFINHESFNGTVAKSCHKGANGDVTAFGTLKSAEGTTFCFGIANCRHKGQRTSGYSCDHGSWFLAQVGSYLRAGGIKTGLRSPKTAPPPSLPAPHCAQQGRAASNS